METAQDLYAMLNEMLVAADRNDERTVKSIRNRFNRVAEPALGIARGSRGTAWPQHPIGMLCDYTINNIVNSLCDEATAEEREGFLKTAKGYLRALEARVNPAYEPAVLNV